MMTPPSSRLRLAGVPTALLTLVLMLAPGAGTWACNIPVFRYALERWEASPYDVVVFHRGELAWPADRVAEAGGRAQPADRMLAALHSASIEGARPQANYRLLVVNVAEPLSDMLQALWQPHQQRKLPLLVAYYPDAAADGLAAAAGGPAAWTAPFDAAAVGQLLDSPARRELAKRLLAGESAVWVLVESGDREADDAAARRLQEGLATAQETLQLPETDADPDAPGPRVMSKLPLKLAFSVLRISRQDAGEAFLTSSLRHTDPKLAESPAPLAFVVFGRGRVLGPLAGPDIKAEFILDAGAYITGACSCEIKSQNPGTDLLMAADWDALIEDRLVQDPEIPDLSSVASLLVPGPAAAGPSAAAGGPVPQATAVPSGQAPTDRGDSGGTSPLVISLLVLLGAAAAVLLVLALVVSGRARKAVS